jgi:hypothetical protein
MQKYILGKLSNPADWQIHRISEFIPGTVLMVLPAELNEEEIEWLTVTPLQVPVEVSVTLPDESVHTVLNLVSASVNSTLKTEILAARAQAARMLVRAKNRVFGEQIIDSISLLNEDAEVDAAGLETILLDQDLTVIREMLWTGSITSAHSKLVSIEEKAKLLFGEPNYLKIKTALEQYLGI